LTIENNKNMGINGVVLTLTGVVGQSPLYLQETAS